MKRIKRILSAALAGALCLSLGAPGFAADPILQEEKTTSNLTIHMLQQVDQTETGMDGTGLPDQTIPDTATPLAGVTVTIVKVDDLTTDPEAAEKLGPEIVLVTGEDGLASFTDIPNGRYLVEYSNFPVNVRGTVKDHLVDLPSRNADGTGWNYDVHVYPKMETVYGSVILTKYAEDGTTGLPGAKFRLYYRSTDGTYTEEYQTPSGVKTEFVTNAAGQIAVSALPDGSYAFIETEAPQGYLIDTTPVEFTVTESGTYVEQDGVYVRDMGVVYTVSRVDYEQPEIHKGVKSIENQHAGYDGDDMSTWVISPKVPTDILRYTKFVVKDDVNGLDDRLSFAGLDTLEVVVSDVSLDSTKFTAGALSAYTRLTKGRDYTAAWDAESETFTVTFVDESFTGGAAAIKDQYVYIVFGCYFDTAQFELDDIMGDAIYNQAELIYNNSFMTEDGVMQTETPEIHTGGMTGYKFADGAALAGAEFKLAASEADAVNGIYIKNAAGEEYLAVSDADGIFRFEGISYGEDGVENDAANTQYWLVETKAPDGYKLIGKPVAVTVNSNSHRYDSLPELQLENIAIPKLPTTGGIGYLPLVIGGAVAFLGAVMVFIWAIRKEKEVR